MLQRRMLFLIFTLLSFNLYAGIINPNDAVVTGFSGTLAEPQNAIDFIDLAGPSLRIITLPGNISYGLVKVPKRFTVTAKDIGQVFGVTLDDQSPANIYVAATSNYGLAIYNAETGRVQLGEASAEYVPGIFGPKELQGSASSIWRIDGKTGAVSLFANVNFNGITNTPASLGGLAFDPRSKRIFVADRATGMIHYFSMDGKIQGVYDHGTTGLATAGQAEVPFNPATIVNIDKETFDTKNPGTWGFAPIGRRVYALAVYQNRLYYSVYGPQVWSVGINADGSIANDARFELQYEPLKADSEIASIAFDDRGWMYTAERGATTGDYDFINLANGGDNRVKRFEPVEDSSSKYLWKTPGDEYAISMPPDFKNADGGVDLNCRRAVWATAERLLDTGNPEDTFAKIDGLQGTINELVRPSNIPPSHSWYINYYDHESVAESRGHMGAIVISRQCKSITPSYLPPTGGYVEQPPVVVEQPPTIIIPTCPPGTFFVDGYCIYRGCPNGFIRYHDRCIRPPRICPYGTVYVYDRCVPIGCPPNTIYRHGHCEPQHLCPRGELWYNGRCNKPRGCKPSQLWVNGKCVDRPLRVPPIYTPPSDKKPPLTIKCGPGYYFNGKTCVPKRIIHPLNPNTIYKPIQKPLNIHKPMVKPNDVNQPINKPVIRRVREQNIKPVTNIQ